MAGDNANTIRRMILNIGPTLIPFKPDDVKKIIEGARVWLKNGQMGVDCIGELSGQKRDIFKLLKDLDEEDWMEILDGVEGYVESQHGAMGKKKKEAEE